MDVELGITNIAKSVNFSTDDDAEQVRTAIATAVADDGIIDLVDSTGRRIVVPARSLGYALIGSTTKRAVGFGAL